MLKRSTLIVVGIFIILVVVAVLILRYQENTGEEAGLPIESSYLIDIGESEIIAIEIQNSDGSKVIVRRNTDGNWILEDPPNQVADESRIDTAVSQAGTLRTISKLELEVDLADLGPRLRYRDRGPGRTRRAGYPVARRGAHRVGLEAAPGHREFRDRPPPALCLPGRLCRARRRGPGLWRHVPQRLRRVPGRRGRARLPGAHPRRVPDPPRAL